MAKRLENTKNNKLRKRPNKLDTPLEEGANITIRLSDLGIKKRTPEEVELQIQSGRILSIIDTTIEKLKIATCLPAFLKNDACILHHRFKDEEVEFMRNVCWKYTLPPYFSKIQKSALYEEYSQVIDKIPLNEYTKHETTKNGDTFVDPLMAQVMEMLWSNKSLRDKVERDFEKLVDTPSKTLISCIKSIKQIAETKLATTAMQKRNREKNLKKAWKENSEMVSTIANIKEKIEKQRRELGNQVQIKKQAVQDYTNRVEELKKKFQEDIKQKIAESEKEMTEDTGISVSRQSELSAEAKNVVTQYESLLSQHLAYEKRLRAKRLKVETQLCSWLAKYDSDVGDRQNELEELIKGYEEENEMMANLQEKFDEQEEEYVILMAERDEEEERIREEIVTGFLRLRAARIIQRAWRAYRERKRARRKARKGKKKKK